MPEKRGANFNKLAKKAQKFECDFIFIQKRFGVVLIKTLECDEGENILENYNNELKQLHCEIDGIRNFYTILSNEPTEIPFQIRGVVMCIPHVLDEAENINCIELAGTNTQFDLFWEPISEDQWFHLTPASRNFLLAIVTYRSAAFISGICNALEIYRRIDKQNFTNTTINESDLIIFNSEQLRVIESTAQCVVISGPPGCGKTLCLLQRALNEAKKKGQGRVILVAV